MTLVDRIIGAARRRLAARDARPPYRRGDDLSIAVPFGYAARPAPVRCAVVIHLFHPEMAGEFLDLCANVPDAVDVYASTDTPAKADAIRRAFGRWRRGAVVVRVAPNRGRDMPSKFVTFRDDLAGYDLLLFLHSKKSEYLNRAGDWRQVLLRSLVGSPATVASIVAMFQADATLGIVFPQHYDGIRDRLEWGANRRRTGALARRLGIPLGRSRALDFVSGSMFWARPAALAPLWSLELATGDFDPEQGQLDGTIAHALERLILYGAEHAGFSWLKVADPALYAAAGDILPVEAPDRLPAVMRRAAFRLLPG